MNNNLVLQISILVVIFLFLINLIFKLNENKLTKKEFFLWFVLILVLALVVFVPSFLRFFADIFGIGRPIDVFIYTAIILLFYGLYKINIKIDELDNNITKIVEEVAIKNAKKGKKK